MQKPLMPTYARLPLSFTHGEGVYLYSQDGTRYLDAVAGIAVNSLGHSHPRLTSALCSQAKKLIHTSNLYRIERQEELAERLTTLSGMDNAFFCNSGAEANEAAIKLARRLGHNKGYKIPKIIVAEGSFHGRTLATLSATGNDKIKEGFDPLVEGFLRVPYNDIDAIKALASSEQEIIAIFLEPIQGEGGVRIPDEDYLSDVQRLCRKNGWLMMLDEVQTGIGRTGRWFGFQHYGVTPDVITLAKGLGGGVPIGSCLARGEAAEVLTPGTHGSTFGGNPLACAAALEVLATINEELLCERAGSAGKLLKEKLLEALSTETQVVKEIRGKGLMTAIELESPCTDLVVRAIEERQLLINVTAQSVIRLLPPLIIESGHLAQIAHDIAELVSTK